MTHLRFFLLAMIAFLQTLSSTAQTPVSGGIYANTTWTLANSPYLITGPIVVFPTRTLTIEPGVRIMVQANTDTMTGISKNYLEIRGNLLAVGTPAAPIIFTTDSINAPNYVPVYTPYQPWYGIVIKEMQGATASFNYITIDHSSYGITNEDASSTDTLRLKGCTFSNNLWGINRYGQIELDSCIFINNFYPVKGDPYYGLSATNCLFEDNVSTIPFYGAGSNLSNCQFLNNQYAVQNSVGGLVNNCIFQGNEWAFSQAYGSYTITNSQFINNINAISSIENSTISDCEFSNNGLGISFGAGMSIQNCTINNNQRGLVTLGLFGQGQQLSNVKNNQVCYNSLYNIENGTNLNLGLEQNCFCETDSATIEAKIYDGYDDITRGLFNYAVYDSSCQTVLYYVQKANIDPVNIDQSIENKNINLFPNPTKTKIRVQIKPLFAQSNRLVIWDIHGKQMLSQEVLSQEINLDVAAFPVGIYFLQVGNELSKFVKID